MTLQAFHQNFLICFNSDVKIVAISRNVCTLPIVIMDRQLSRSYYNFCVSFYNFVQIHEFICQTKTF